MIGFAIIRHGLLLTSNACVAGMKAIVIVSVRLGEERV